VVDSIFIRGLALFKMRIAYANIVNDRSVPYHTAAISQYDPYLDLTKFNISYLPNYAVIVHPTHPIIPLTKPKDLVPQSRARRYLFPIALAILVPLWATFFVLASLWQSFFSWRRIRDHLSVHDTRNEVDEPTEDGLSGAVQEVFEDVVDNVALVSPVEERDDDFFSETSTFLDHANGNGYANGAEKSISFMQEEYKLALTEEQIVMMRGLRSVSWKTFGVHIHQTMHSHAAIIWRNKWRRELNEGNIVLQHWLKEQFQV
jgi:hypothetical protein